MSNEQASFTTEEIEQRLAQTRKQFELWRGNAKYGRILSLDIAALESMQYIRGVNQLIIKGTPTPEMLEQLKCVSPINGNLEPVVEAFGPIFEALLQRYRQSTDENTRLRAALATSKSPCVYCQLPADEWAKCQSGFPGCARADDASGCPEFGAMMENHDLRKAISDTIESLERGSTSAPVVECLKAALGLTKEDQTNVD